MDKSETILTAPLSRFGSRRRWIKLLLLTLLIGVALLMGRDLAHHLRTLEARMVSLGWAGPVVFIGTMVVLASLLVPDTVFAVVAGALFGLGGGTLLMVAGSVCTATVDFAVSRLLLQETVHTVLARRPRLASLHRAVDHEGLRFQFLVRLTPLNPVIVNYVFGTTETKFPTYLMACVGMIPTLAVEVYFGHAVRHAAGVAEHSAMQTVLTMAGLVLCVAVVLYISRIARKALAAYLPGGGGQGQAVNSPADASG